MSAVGWVLIVALVWAGVALAVLLVLCLLTTNRTTGDLAARREVVTKGSLRFPE